MFSFPNDLPHLPDDSSDTAFIPSSPKPLLDSTDLQFQSYFQFKKSRSYLSETRPRLELSASPAIFVCGNIQYTAGYFDPLEWTITLEGRRISEFCFRRKLRLLSMFFDRSSKSKLHCVVLILRREMLAKSIWEESCASRKEVSEWKKYEGDFRT